MVEQSIQIAVRRYIEAARAAGFHVRRAVLFGSHARGAGNEWSDIDLVVIAPELDGPTDRRLVSKLWELRAFTDSRIEPIPCGEREWDSDGDRPILEIARREGIIITPESLMQ
ncbi:MAG TPA: nucleotidyltransferase domain-containing protein [bacterium]|nr:nucleotidyltransferase domain-containing protein [bacterium]